MEGTNEIVDVRTKEHASAIEHARWLTTLCLAEMAGIIGYLDLEGRKVTILWALILVVLGASIVLFIATIILSRRDTKGLLSAYAETKKKVRENEVRDVKNRTPNDIQTESGKLMSAFETSLSSSYESGGRAEFVAHIGFGLATCLAAVFLLLIELSAMFGDWIDYIF